MDLQIGDRVRVIRAYQDNTAVVGTEGTVCGLKYDGHVVCVNHDVYSGVMHHCNGLCEQGHGWNYYVADATKYFELISHTPEISIQAIDELL